MTNLGQGVYNIVMKDNFQIWV